MKNGNGGHRINGGDQRSEREALDEAQFISHAGQAEDVNAGADDQGRYGGADDGKHQDRADVLEEVALVQVVAGLEYDRGQEDEEEGGRRERLFVAPVGDVLFGHEIDDETDDGAEEHDDHALGQVLEVRGQHQVYEQDAQSQDAEHEEDGDRAVTLLFGRPFLGQHWLARHDGRRFLRDVRDGFVGRWRRRRHVRSGRRRVLGRRLGPVGRRRISRLQQVQVDGFGGGRRCRMVVRDGRPRLDGVALVGGDGAAAHGAAQGQQVTTTRHRSPHGETVGRRTSAAASEEDAEQRATAEGVNIRGNTERSRRRRRRRFRHRSRVHCRRSGVARNERFRTKSNCFNARGRVKRRKSRDKKTTAQHWDKLTNTKQR